MAVNRDNIFDENSSPAPTQTQFLTQYGDLVGANSDVSVHYLTNVAGTDTITATAEPMTIPSTGYPVGLNVVFVPVATSTGAVTLNIDGRGDVPVIARDGTALAAGALSAGTAVLGHHDGSNFLLLTPVAASAGAPANRIPFSETGTFDNIYPPDTNVLVRLWGGGAGGSTVRGGGGGSFAWAIFRAGDLGASETVIIGSGGAISSAGGDTTFGAHLTAFGASGRNGAGEGAKDMFPGGGEGAFNATDASTAHGGGAGADESDPASAGRAVWGGGGGGDAGSFASGGTSLYGGDGGDDGVPGAVKGGGGGRNAVGGDGFAEIFILGD